MSTSRRPTPSPIPPGADPPVVPNLVVVENPDCVEVPLSALVDWVTPTDRYFIRNHLPVPQIRTDDWRLRLEGQVRAPHTIDYPELLRLPQRTVIVTTECAGNSRSRDYPAASGVPWKDGAVGTARWTGASLGDLLERAGPLDGAQEVVLEGADRGIEPGVPGELRYAMSLPMEKALDPDTLLAVSMNDEPLRPDHGFPVRAVVPGWYGMASVKWVTRIEVISHAFEGYYRTKPYVVIEEGDHPDRPRRPVTVLRVKSLITQPSPGATFPPGRLRVAGVAWSGLAPIARVDVRFEPRTDGGTSGWTEATLVGPRSPYAWVHWEARLHLDAPGCYVLRARATDRAGHVQPLEATWNYRGVETNSVHAVPILVREPTDAAPLE